MPDPSSELIHNDEAYEFCPNADLIWSIIDRTLENTQFYAAKKHLKNCPQCRKKIYQAQRVLGQIDKMIPKKKINENVAEGLWPEVNGLLREIQSKSPERRRPKLGAGFKKSFYVLKEMGKQSFSKRMLGVYFVAVILSVTLSYALSP